MDEPFDSAWLKWGRAIVHGHSLEDEMTRFADQASDHVTLGYRHYDAKRHGFPVEIAEIEPWPSHWGPILGDMVANFRNALDHIAWAIVQRGRGGAKGLPLSGREASRVYFPIVHTSNRGFNRTVDSKLIGARRVDIAIVRKAQPYHRGARGYRRNALYILDSLSKKDKHRTIQPVHVLPVEGTYRFVEMRDCERSSDMRRPRLRRVEMKVGEELGVVRVRKTGPNPYVNVEAALTVVPGITTRTPLREWFQETARVTRAILLMLGSAPPDSLAELGNPSWFFPPGEAPSRSSP